MKTKHTLIVLSMLAGIGLLAQKKPEIEGNKTVIELRRDLPGSFNTLKVDDDLEIRINPGERNGYAMEIDSNLVDVIKFQVVDTVLSVYTTHEIRSKKKLDIVLDISRLEHLILNSKSKVVSKDPVKGSRFRLTGYESSRFDLKVEADWVSVDLYKNAGGKIEIESENTSITMVDRTDMKARVRTDQVVVKVGNSAELNIDGQGEHANYQLEKSSKLDGRDMKVRTAVLTSTNRADVYVHATNKIDVDIEGGSKVYVYGNPDVNVVGLTDKSKIIKR